MGGTVERCVQSEGAKWPMWLPVSDPVLGLDEAYYLAFMARALELADRPLFETRDAWAALHDEVPDAPWYAILSRLIVVAFPSVVEFSESHRARVDLAMIALGGEASGPDPFTGKPYETDREVLRSPGPDAEDESDDITWRLGSGRDGN